MPGTSDYFGVPLKAPIEPGRFTRVDELAGYEVAPGLLISPLLGTGMMVAFARFAPTAEAPRHAHVEEQILVVLDGEFTVDLDGEVRILTVGDVAVIPSWVPHRVVAGPQGGYEADIFCPPRQGLLDQMAGGFGQQSCRTGSVSSMHST